MIKIVCILLLFVGIFFTFWMYNEALAKYNNLNINYIKIANKLIAAVQGKDIYSSKIYYLELLLHLKDFNITSTEDIINDLLIIDELVENKRALDKTILKYYSDFMYEIDARIQFKKRLSMILIFEFIILFVLVTVFILIRIKKNRKCKKTDGFSL